MQTGNPPDAPVPPPPAPDRPATPLWWRAAIAAGVLTLALVALLAEDFLGPRGRAALGVCCFIGLAFVFCRNLRAVNWQTIGWGLALQVGLALLVLRWPPGYEAFKAAGGVVKKFLEFSSEGAAFVFGALARPADAEKAFGKGNGFLFAFVALPTIVFVSSFVAWIGPISMIFSRFV